MSFKRARALVRPPYMLFRAEKKLNSFLVVTATASHPQQGFFALAAGSQPSREELAIGKIPLGSLPSDDASDAEELRTFCRDSDELVEWHEGPPISNEPRHHSAPLPDDIKQCTKSLKTLPTIFESTPGPHPPQHRRNSISSPERVWEINPEPHPTNPHSKRLSPVEDWGPMQWVLPSKVPHLKKLPPCPQSPTPMPGPSFSSLLLHPPSPTQVASPTPSSNLLSGKIGPGRLSKEVRERIDGGFETIFKMFGDLAERTAVSTSQLFQLFSQERAIIQT